MQQQIAEWLASLGLSEYAQRFAEEDVEFETLGDLTDHDFDRLGVSVGHRRKMLRAIRGVEGLASPVKPQPTPRGTQRLTSTRLS